MALGPRALIWVMPDPQAQGDAGDLAHAEVVGLFDGIDGIAAELRNSRQSALAAMALVKWELKSDSPRGMEGVAQKL